jgi:hypothetical protein
MVWFAIFLSLGLNGGEAFTLKREQPTLETKEIPKLFSIFAGHFCLLRSGRPKSRRIWIYNTGFCDALHIHKRRIEPALKFLADNMP